MKLMRVEKSLQFGRSAPYAALRGCCAKRLACAPRGPQVANPRKGDDVVARRSRGAAPIRRRMGMPLGGLQSLVRPAPLGCCAKWPAVA
jgi:hypothetical protein